MERFDCGRGYIFRTIALNNRLKAYETYLEYAKENNYSIVPLFDFWRERDMKSNKYFILRHDVDYVTEATKLLFEIERQHSVKSTYYFRSSTMDYKLISEMENAGFEVGYHFETLSDYVKATGKKNITEEDIAICREKLKDEICKCKEHFNLKSICAHGAPENAIIGVPNNYLTENQNYTDYGICFEAYDRRLYENIDVHIMDNNIRHNSGFAYKSNPLDAINEGQRSILFLSHPNHWHFSFDEQMYNMIAFVAKRYELDTEREFVRLKA